jgi:hypothetical protein
MRTETTTMTTFKPEPREGADHQVSMDVTKREDGRVHIVLRKPIGFTGTNTIVFSDPEEIVFSDPEEIRDLCEIALAAYGHLTGED